eukprot:jgi/Antlo1/779/1429
MHSTSLRSSLQLSSYSLHSSLTSSMRRNATATIFCSRTSSCSAYACASASPSLNSTFSVTILLNMAKTLSSSFDMAPTLLLSSLNTAQRCSLFFSLTFIGQGVRATEAACYLENNKEHVEQRCKKKRGKDHVRICTEPPSACTAHFSQRLADLSERASQSSLAATKVSALLVHGIHDLHSNVLQCLEPCTEIMHLLVVVHGPVMPFATAKKQRAQRVIYSVPSWIHGADRFCAQQQAPPSGRGARASILLTDARCAACCLRRADGQPGSSPHPAQWASTARVPWHGSVRATP